MPNLIVLMGLPGSGKTTWVKTFYDLKAGHVSSDEIRTKLAGSTQKAHKTDIKPWDEFYESLTTYLEHGVDTIADATFLLQRHRIRAREVAQKASAPLHLVVFKNWYDAFQRNASRPEATRVPSDAWNNMMNLFWDALADIEDEKYATVTKIEAFR